MESQKQGTAGGRAIGAVLLVGAVVVFIVCSVVQAAGDSSMFSASYVEPDSAVLDLLMQVTFWPGWILTAALAFGGVRKLLTGD